MKCLISFFLIVSINCNAQIFSTEVEDSLTKVLGNYMSKPTKDKDVLKAWSLIGGYQFNALSAMIAEQNFKAAIKDLNNFNILNKSEKAVQSKIYFRTDTATNYTPTQSVSSRWINGIPYIEYYPKWVYGFSNYIYTYLLTEIETINRSNFDTVYRSIYAINDSIDWFAEANLDSSSYEKVFSMTNLVTYYSISYFNYLFVYLHELGHLCYPNFSEVDCDKFASDKFFKLIEFYIPASSKIYDDLQKEELNSDVPLNSGKYSLYFMTLTHLEYISNLFVYSPYDYDKTLLEFSERKKYLYNRLYDILNCDSLQNFSTSICSGCRDFIFKDEKLTNATIKTRHFYLEWDKLLKKGDTTTFFSYLRANYKNGDAPFIEACIILCENKNYSEALKWLSIFAEVKSFTAAEKELCYLLISKIYQFRIRNKKEAITNLYKAREISILMPKEYYTKGIAKIEINF